MTRDEIRLNLLEILKAGGLVDKSETGLPETTNFTKDLKTDSLDGVEIVMEVEDEFGIKIPDDDAEKLKTVGQMIDYVFSQVNKGR